MNKINCNTICECINDFISINGYNEEYLSLLQTAVLMNDIINIEELLASNNTIYYDDILCSGLYQSKFEYHPTNCHKIVCKKTAVYYGLWLNTLIYTNIIIEIINLLDNSPCLHFRNGPENNENNDNKEETDLDTISLTIKDIYMEIIKLDDSLCIINDYKDYYTHESMYFEKIYNLFNEKIPDLLQLLNRRYSSIDVNNDTTQLLYKKHPSMISWKNKLGKLYIYDGKTRIIDHSKQLHIINNITKLYNYYQRNVNIVKLLFNQQSYEYYKHTIKFKGFKIHSVINEIKKNPFIDFNYVCKSENNNILSYTLKSNEMKDLSNTLFKISNVLPTQFEIMDIIKKEYYGNLIEIFRMCDGKCFSDIYGIFTSILSLKNIRTSDKLEMIEIIANRKLLNNIQGIISIAIKHDLSLDIIKILSKYEKIMTNVTLEDIILCIKIRKPREIDVLISTNKLLLQTNNYDDYLLNIYLQETVKDYSLNIISILDVILSKKITLEIQDNLDRTILINAVISGRTKTVNALLEAGSNSFHLDSNGYNALHYAIMHQYCDIIKLLSLKVNKDGDMLVNEPTSNHEYPLHILIKTNDPVRILKCLQISETLYIQDEKGLNYGVRDNNGNTVLHYILIQKLPTWIKTKLYRLLINKNINLLEQSRLDYKPIVIKAVEYDLYDISVIIMDKLLRLKEISIKGIDNIEDKSIIDIIKIDKNINSNIILKNLNNPNFYSLVILYLQNDTYNKTYTKKKLKNFTNFIMICIVVITTFRTLYNYNFVIHYCLITNKYDLLKNIRK